MKKIVSILIFFCPLCNIMAQISTREVPYSFNMKDENCILQSDIVKVTMPEVDVQKLMLEDKENEGKNLPLRFGYSHHVSMNLTNSGSWHNLPNGDKIWLLTIKCPKALSVSLLYDKYWIPEGGKFFIYTTDKKHHLGAFTGKNNKADKEKARGFATGLLPGEEITLEYYQPCDADTGAIISISNIVHGYKELEILTRSGIHGTSESCQINVNCPEGYDWQNEKKAVAFIIVDGRSTGTGALVNTTANDGKPYLLTANHLLDEEYNGVLNYDALSDKEMDCWVFYWNYELSGCNENNSYYFEESSTTGATVIANNADTDFALLELHEDPILNGYIPYYLGWNRTGNSGSGGVCIHHPHGDAKKISTYEVTPLSTLLSQEDYSLNGLYWKVNWCGSGTTENISSGSPLLDNNHKLIGQLWGGYNGCYDQTKPSWYGRFDLSWTGRGDYRIQRRLDHWLDSLGTGQTTLNGYDATPNISGPRYICDQETYSINAPYNSTVQWALNNNNATIISGQGTKTIVIRKNNDGIVKLTASIYKHRSFVRQISQNNIIIGNPLIGDMIEPYGGDGGYGYWTSNLCGNHIVLDGFYSLPPYLCYEANLYRISEDYNPYGTLVHHWNNFPLNTIFDYYPQGWYLLQIRGVNECGVSEWLEQEIECIDTSVSSPENPGLQLKYDRTCELLTVTVLNAVDNNHGEMKVYAGDNLPEVQLWNETSMVSRHIMREPTISISMTGFRSGLYTVRVINKEETKTKKFIKR